MASSHNCPAVYPGGLLDGSLHDECDRQWWAYYTKARQEKSSAEDLRAMSIPRYLPLIHRSVLYGRSRVHRWIPLFPGYVFVFASEDERVQSLTTNRVTTTLRVMQPDRLRQDLLQLQRLIESGEPVTAEDRLEEGDRVRVRSGALAGIEGLVLQRRGQRRLLVSVDFLQKGASIAIDQDLLEVIS